MLSTRVIDGLTIHRAGRPFHREIQLAGGSDAEQAQVRRDLEALLTEDPSTGAFRLALGRAELVTRRTGMSIGLSREDEAVLRRKLDSATTASLEEVRSTARATWA
jgi:hypothetical protein